MNKILRNSIVVVGKHILVLKAVVFVRIFFNIVFGFIIKNSIFELNQTNSMKVKSFFIAISFSCLSFIKTSAQSPWTIDTTRNFKLVVEKTEAFLDSLSIYDTSNYKKERKDFINWYYFNFSRLDSLGKYGNYNKYLLERIFPDTNNYTYASVVNVESSSGCFGSGNWSNIGPFKPYSAGNHNGVCTKVIKSPFNNANTMYIGSVAGGMFKTTNGGQQWTPLEFIGANGERASSIGTSDIVVWHNSNTNNDIVLASTGYDWHRPSFTGLPGSSLYGFGVLKSSNGGQSWEKTSLTFSPNNEKFVTRLIKDEINIGTVYAIVFKNTTNGPQSSLFKSTNFGKNWNELTGVDNNDNFQFLEIHPTDPSSLYLVGFNKLQKSSDGGINWVTTYSFSPALSAVHIATIKNAVATGTESNVYLLTVTGGIKGTFDILESTDNGNTFVSVYEVNNNNNRNNNRYLSFANSSKIWIQVSFYSGDQYPTIYLGGNTITRLDPKSNGKYTRQNPYYFSFDYSSPEMHADIRYMELLRSDEIDTLLIGTDGGISRIVDGRNSNSSNPNVQHLHYDNKEMSLSTSLSLDINPNKDKLIMAMQDNAIFELNNPNNNEYNWTGIDFGDAGSVTYEKYSDNYYYGFYNCPECDNLSFSRNFFPYIRPNSSYNWQFQDQTISNYTLYTPSYDPGTAIFDLLAVSINSSSNPTYPIHTLTSTTARSNNSIIDIEVGHNDTNIVYYAVNDRRYNAVPIQQTKQQHDTPDSNGNYSFPLKLFMSKDGINSTASSWVEISVNYDANDFHDNNDNDISELASAPITDIEVNEQNDNEVWVSLGGFITDRIFHSTNTGDRSSSGANMAIWNEITTAGLPPGPINCLKHLPGDKWVLFAGTEAGIFYLPKDETVWHPLNNNMPQCIVTDIAIDHKNNIIYAASYGRGIWRSYLPCIGCTEPSVAFETISSNQTWTKNSYRTESIIIPSNVTLKIKDCSIHMPARGEIIVEKGGELILENARITNSCWRMWAGIDALGDGPLNSQTDANSGTVRMINSIVENATDAFEVMSGGRIFATNCELLNNKIGITFYPFYGNSTYQHSLTNVKFINNDTIDGGGSTNVHVIIHNNSIRMDNCSFENTILQSDLGNKDRGAGILVFNGALKMYPELTYVPNTLPCSYTGVTSRPYFRQLDVGIEWYNPDSSNPQNGRPNKIQVYDHDFLNCGRGLYSNGSFSDYFYHNNIKYLENISDYLNPKYINPSSTWTSFIAGAFLKQSQGTSFYSNAFERLSHQTDTLNYQDTIYDIIFYNTDNSTPLQNILTTTLQENEFSNTSRISGATYTDFNVANYFYGNNQKISMKCNEYDNKYLSYLFYGDVSNKNFINTTTEALAQCDGLNNHNSYPGIQLIDERIINSTPFSAFILWDISRYATSNPSVSLAANGTSYIKNPLPNCPTCPACTTVSFADIYCNGNGGGGEGEYVAKNNDNIDPCESNKTEEEVINAIIHAGLDFKNISGETLNLIDSLKRIGCISHSLQNILDYSGVDTQAAKLGLGSESTNLSKFILFPNPSDNEIKISYLIGEEQLSTRCYGVIYDASGKKIELIDLIGEKGVRTIDTRGFAEGVYTMIIISDGKILKIIRFNIIHE